MDAASMEQMNKLRKSLGLPLLNVPGGGSSSSAQDQQPGPSFKKSNRDGESDDEPASTLETREAAGYANFQAIQDEEKRRLDREKRKKTIQRAREIAARSVRLEGKGLGDLDDEVKGDQDAKAWLKGQKKRQKDIEKERARRLDAEIAERERIAAIEYTGKDLAGVKVAHELGDFDDGVGEQILTLKDQEIGDEDDDNMGDVLENADIVAKDRLKEKLDLKKKIVYDVHDTDDKALLSQYDEKKRKAFTLDSSGGGTAVDERESKRQAIGDRLKDMVSLDILKQEPISDYQEVKIKKAKKAKKTKRVKEADEDDIFPTTEAADNDSMELDGRPVQIQSRSKMSETNLNDDEDLANALGFTRRAALKKQKRKAADIVRLLKEEEEERDMENGSEQGLTLDDTTTFLDNLAARPPSEEPEQKVSKSVERHVPADTLSPDAEMGEAYAITEDNENADALLAHLRREQATHTPEVQESTHTGLDEEKSLTNGLGAALNLLRERGLVKASRSNETNPSNLNANDLYRARQTFLSESKLRTHVNDQRARAQRERDRNTGKLNHLSLRERELEAHRTNTQREHQTSIAAAAAFNQTYKPDVQLKYIDDDGREMNTKEAFKHLSHQFHGKGSGKGKTEKKIKRVMDEQRREARSVLDASEDVGRGYEGAAQHQRRGGEAGVRLQ